MNTYTFYFYHSTRNPNKDSPSSLPIINSNIQWKPYTTNEHNYLFFQLNNIHNEHNYYDSMYYFWLKCFQTELNGICNNEFQLMKMKKHLAAFLIILFVLLIIVVIYFICKHFQTRQRYRTPTDLAQYPNFVTT